MARQAYVYSSIEFVSLSSMGIVVRNRGSSSMLFFIIVVICFALLRDRLNVSCRVQLSFSGCLNSMSIVFLLKGFYC